jgi:poly(A) polymerase
LDPNPKKRSDDGRGIEALMVLTQPGTTKTTTTTKNERTISRRYVQNRSSSSSSSSHWNHCAALEDYCFEVMTSNKGPQSQPPPPPIDMSVKVGGRLFQPALPVVDGSPPNEHERRFQATLDVFIQDGVNVPLETKQGIQTRERVLNQIKRLCRDWIRHVCLEKGLPADVVDAAGGQLFTSGSYRLGVHEPGADIDTILVVPSVVRRQDFFGTTNMTAKDGQEAQRDPNSLAERIRRHPDVTNFVPVEGAAVPLLTFDWEGVNIDLLFARLNANSVPADFDIDNDAVLDGVDAATEKSLNGPRVTNLIAHFVNGTPARYQAFLTVVRCVRKWAKARGLYSNKMGYYGGVNINIAVA